MAFYRHSALVFLFCCVTSAAIAQYRDETLELFDREIDSVLIYCGKSHTKEIVIAYETFHGKGGEKGKVKIDFLNDSVFEQSEGLHKSYHVITDSYIYDYDMQAKARAIYKPLLPDKDSAGYKIYRGSSGSNDSSQISYCRIKQDSLYRMTDYYFTINQTVRHQTWKYEGDTACWHESWESEADTMRLIYKEYVCYYYNSDSSFYTTVTKRYYLPREMVFPYDAYHSMKTFITYDDMERIIEVRKEEFDLTDGQSSPEVETHVMKVKYVSR